MKETVLSNLEVGRNNIIVFFIYELCLSHVQKSMGEGKSYSVEETLQEGSERADLDRQLEEG